MGKWYRPSTALSTTALAAAATETPLKSWKVEREPAQVGKRPDEGGRRVAQVEHEATTGAVIHDDVPGCATMDEFSQER
jgi:hypothetical protein